MVMTKKFSQFNGPSPIQNGDIVVGLRDGDNYQFTGVGGGGGGTSIIIIIDQPNHGFLPGNWVTVDTTGLYVLAQANTAKNAEIAGCVLSVQNANQFTLQVIGFVPTGTFTGLTTGLVYFLSDTTPGEMTLNEPVTNGFVSIPVFIATSPTEGWIRQWRGFIIGGQPNNQGGGGGNNPVIVIIDQPGHGLNLGDIVRLDGSITYVRAQADTLAHAQALGMVIQVIDSNHFALQVDGYEIGALSQDDAGNPLVAASVYYLSATVAGKVTATPPASVGQATKPMFVCEQTFGTTGANAGYILPQRPLENTSSNVNPNIVTIHQVAHGLSVGNWVYISGSVTYTKAIGTSFATSQAVGVVINVIDADHFVLQTNGYNAGAVTQDDTASPIVASDVYYLSTTVAGAITPIEPTGVGLFTKPLFTCEQTFGTTGINAGYILDQRPLSTQQNNIPSIVTIHQVAHGLTKGQVVRLSGSIIYVPAKADNLADSQGVGIVIDVVDANNFVLQTEGYTTNTITVDENNNPLVAATVYYISPTVAGAVTAVEPTTVGQATKPMFICEQTGVGTTAGYIMPQRPILITPGSTTPDIVTVTQTGHGFNVGDWLYITSTSGVQYSRAIGTSLASSQAVGVVIQIVDANHFVLQTNGYNTGAVTKDEFGNPLTPSTIYYLSTSVAGALTATIPNTVGQYTKPLYACEQTTAITGTNAGFVLEQRPLSVSEGNNPNIVIINQPGHGLTKGLVVRLSGSITYVPALADTLAHSQAVGVVILVIDANNFILQTEGYTTNTITTDAAGSPLTAAGVYYLSPTVAGKVTLTVPTAVGQATKPMFICEQTGGTTAGYIMPQRPLEISPGSTTPDIVTITQTAHGFSVGDWLYIQGSIFYAKGIATALATSQVVGVVIQVIDANHFVLQTNGYNVGAVSVDDTGAPVVASTIYYLSTTVAGRLRSTAPSTIGQITKPLYACEQASGITGTNAGYVLEQRPLIVSPSGGGGGEVLITTVNVTNQNFVYISNIFGGYQDIRIIGENLIFKYVPTGAFYGSSAILQWEVNGSLATDSNYNYIFDVNYNPGGSNGFQTLFPYFLLWANYKSSSGNLTHYTQNGFCFTFDAYVYGVNTTTTNKTLNIEYYSANSIYISSISTLIDKYTLWGAYNGNTQAITGFKFGFTSTSYIIVSGKISVYGVPIN